MVARSSVIGITRRTLRALGNPIKPSLGKSCGVSSNGEVIWLQSEA